ncbi:hypothetical protein PYW07_002212 [Mythimna separata]|uniref:N-acyl-aliphatic-L-amino acid amidohydrolase n=1 Tax=Mythimna separata TaxID=271217 RepID=A0AAD7YP65_MYTSE|nr:hypothetical protein PYW07_002212 [Mythimna separata]
MEYYIPNGDVPVGSSARPWFNAGCAEAEKRKHSAFLSWVDARDRKAPDLSSKKRAFNHAAKSYKKALRKARFDRISHIGQKLSAQPSGSRAFWSLAKSVEANFCRPTLPPLVRPDGTLAHTAREKAGLFASLFAHNSRLDTGSATPPTLPHCGTSMPEVRIRNKEVLRALCRLDLLFNAIMFGIVSIVLAVLQLQVSLAAGDTDYASKTPVELFQEYLRINTTTHNDLTPAVDFWKALAEAAGVPCNVYEIVPGYPIVVLKWEGTDGDLPSIMLNSHMDVVPADINEGWTYDPFAAHIDDNGVIYGRGTQDMKSVSIQYYEALRRLKENNVQFLRNVYMTLMPDEEVGAENGMIQFVKTAEFKAMNVGIELDEGSSFPLPVVPVFYQDKVVWQIQVDCYGVAAHGSSFPATNDTATGKCRNVIERFFAFRDEQYKIASTTQPSESGGYTSVNLNKLNAGTANNVIPSRVSLVFDIRLGTTVNEEYFSNLIDQFIAESGENINVTYISKNQQSPATIANSSNPYFQAIACAAKQLNIAILPSVPPGSTDARHVRNAGYPAFGLSPMPNTELLLHAVNERLAISTFLNGITVYEKIIDNLANIPESETAEDSSVYLLTTAL